VTFYPRPSQVMSSLPTRIQAAALHHAEVVRQLTALRAAVSSTAELVLGRSPGGTSWVEVMNELNVKFQELEDFCLQIKGPG
jgi:hypothetical protein